MSEKSLYERLGGEAAVDAAVDIFYRRVLGDESIAHHFEDVDMSAQRQKQKAFLSFVFGGPPPAVPGRDLRSAHARLKLTESDFSAVVQHLAATLQTLKVPAPLIDEVARIAGSVKSDVLNR
jgi:hemoglobin